MNKVMGKTSQRQPKNVAQGEDRTPIGTGMYLPNHSGVSNSKEIKDKYVLKTGDTMTGDLNLGSNDITDGSNATNPAEIRTAYDHSQDNSQAHSDYLINNGNDTTSGGLTADYFNVDATSDITIAESSDDLLVTNPNENKDIKFSVNGSGSGAQNFLQINANVNPQVRIGPDDGTVTIGASGMLNFTGSISCSTIGVGMGINPTVSDAAFISTYCNPTVNMSNVVEAFRLSGSWGNYNREIKMLNFSPPAHANGYDDDYKIIAEGPNITRAFWNPGQNDQIDYNQIALGGSVTLLDIATPLVDYTENMIALSGGATRIMGTNGSVNQTGLSFSGFGTQTGLQAGDSVTAMTSDGGFHQHKYDLSSTSGQYFGAANDSRIGYDGTDFNFDTDLVGSGVGKWSASNWTANGSNNVTISNIAPAGVTTATISKWFTLKDNNGTVYYIPAWT